MTRLTLQKQLFRAGLVTNKKATKVERTVKKSYVQAREVRVAVEGDKKAQLGRDKQFSEQQEQAVLAKEYEAQVGQLIEMNRIIIANGDIGFSSASDNLIKRIFADKFAQTQLINGRLATARLLIDNNSESEHATIPASVADRIAQRDASSVVLHSVLSVEEQDEDGPYTGFKVPDDLMWQTQISRVQMPDATLCESYYIYGLRAKCGPDKAFAPYPVTTHRYLI